MFTPFRGLGIIFILTCDGRFYPRRCSDTRSPCIILFPLFPCLGSIPARRCLRAAWSDPRQESTKDAEGTWHPFSSRCPWYFLRMRNSSRGAKLPPAPPTALQATPRYVLGRSSAPPGFVAGAGPPRLLPAAAYVCERMLGGRRVQEGSALPFVFGGLSNAGASLFPKPVFWMGGRSGRNRCCHGTVSEIANLMLWGVKLCFVE